MGLDDVRPCSGHRRSVDPRMDFFGFAVGAFFMGAMIWLGIGTGLSLAWSLVIFAVLSLIAYIIMRQMFGIRRGQVKIWDRDVND